MTSSVKTHASVAEEAYTRILVGYDGSEYAKRALRKAIELTKRSDKGEMVIVVAFDIVSLTMTPTGQYYAPFRDEMVQHAKNLLSEATVTAKQAGINVFGSVEEGPPAHMILAKAIESRADLIVVGRRGIRGIERFFMGSVSSSVVNHSKQDVLVVK